MLWQKYLLQTPTEVQNHNILSKAYSNQLKKKRDLALPVVCLCLHAPLPALKESVALFLAEVFGRWTVIAEGGFSLTMEQSTSFVLLR